MKREKSFGNTLHKTYSICGRELLLLLLLLLLLPPLLLLRTAALADAGRALATILLVGATGAWGAGRFLLLLPRLGFFADFRRFLLAVVITG